MSRFVLIFVVLIIFSLGLVMIFSTTSADVLDHDLEKSPHHALIKQVVFALFGLIAGFFVYRTGFERVMKLTPWIMTFLTLLLLLTLIPGVGRVVNGSRRWLGSGALTFQPSEFAKVFLPLFFIWRLHKISRWKFLSFLMQVLLCLVPIGLVLLEPNNGTVAVMGLTLACVCFLCAVPYKYWAVPLLGCMLVGGVFALQLPYVTARLKVYANPELDIQGKGHQPHQAKIAAGSGQLFGKGPGNGWQKLSYLPEAQNDYIAAIYAEEFGFIGMLFLIFCYMLLIYLGMVIALEAKAPGAMEAAGAITFLISLQAFLNMGVVSGLLPTTGLNLPFFSQGGTSLIANMMAVAFLLAIQKLSLEESQLGKGDQAVKRA